MNVEGKRMIDWSEWAKLSTNPDISIDKIDKPEALEGLVVLDLSYGSFSGLFASSLLAEFGARVIRVEPPKGDIAREMTPDGMKINGTGLPYIVESRNKQNITLNIGNVEGKNILRSIVSKVDVLIETFSPGYMDDMGIGWSDLKKVNNRLIYLALNSYGQKGELAERAKKSKWRDYDVIAQALSGFVTTTGIPDEYTEFPEHTRVPTKMGNWMGWYAGGLYGAFSVMGALIFREFSGGEGQFIDMSPAEALMMMNNYAVQFYGLTGEVMGRPANIEPAAHPYCYVRCKDGMVFVAGYTDPNWKTLCTIIERPDLVEKYKTTKDRVNTENMFNIIAEIEKFTRIKTRDELVSIFNLYKGGPGVAVVGEVVTPFETMKFDHWYERDILKKVESEKYGDLIIQWLPAKMTETPPRIKWIGGEIGEDNAFVYLDILGIDRKELDKLRENEII